MAISDTLFEAQQEIEKYLATGGYGNPGDQDRDQIDNLLMQMARVRMMLDTPPQCDDNMSNDPKDKWSKWSSDAIKGMLRRQIAELEATVNPMLRGGANPDDNELLRHQMSELAMVRRMLEEEEADDE